MEKEDFEKRFGTIAEEQGFVTKEQVIEALEIQVKENMEKGKHRFIGQILISLGYLTQSQLKEMLRLMGIY